MAEARSVVMPGDAVIELNDGTHYYTAIVQDGGFSPMDGEYEHVYPNDQSGRPLSGAQPRAAGIRSLAGIKFRGTVWDTGADGSNDTLADIIAWRGHVGANWTSTLVDPEGLIKTVNCRIVWADRAKPGGTDWGTTWTCSNMRIESAFEPQATATGLFVDLTFRSLTDVKWSVSRND